VGIRREFTDHQSQAAKPSYPELSKRNREAGLTQTIRAYSEMPPTDTLLDGWAGLITEDPPVLRAYKNGTLYEIALEEVA
jgi:hypothetical protein